MRCGGRARIRCISRIRTRVAAREKARERDDGAHVPAACRVEFAPGAALGIAPGTTPETAAPPAPTASPIGPRHTAPRHRIPH